MKYALLIDSENAEPRMDEVFQELTKLGDTPIRYLIGNFTQIPQTHPWLKIAQKHAITCVQTMNFTKGKNSLDISLVIEGMKVLYEKTFIDGVIIVASDSDYTPLAREWRNAGKEVIGIGRKLTPESYRASCTKFIYSENIYNKKTIEEEDNGTEIVSIEKIYEIIEAVLNENNGMAQLSVIVESIRKAYTDFDVRNYGYQKARDFFQASFNNKLKLTEEKKNSYFLSFRDKLDEEVRIVIPLKEEKKAIKKETKKVSKKEVKKASTKPEKKKASKPKSANSKPKVTIVEDDLAL
ncbi:MAG: NYN domain-containing protein [Anaeroplasma sp.]|uniref:NYN domain-containing protein n=1 Tax=Anaeroplasma sp. TaxID=1872523 RepID=UPI002A9142F5|nr:NYN domain-containing protein [Anaeroplasma sp.]MDY5983815.1 NYN domain-containing protein [Anaeroplasma sp.]